MLSVKTAPRRLSAAVTAGALSAIVLSSLALPAQAAPAPAVVRTATDAVYTVKSGDSLWAIASSHGVSLASVFAANNMGMATIIYPGQTIKLSGTATAATPAPAPVAAAPSATSYVVKSGDTLSRIASSHGVSLASVLAANNMGMSTIIYPGQTIKLSTAAAPAPAAKPAPALTIQIGPAPAPVAAPAAKPSGSYVVKAGDTLSRIASANGVSLATVLAANGMSMSTIIYPGQSIKLTGAPVAVPAPVAPAAPAPAPSSSTSVKQLVADTARSMGVDVSLALAIAEQESGFRQNVVSSAGAIGTMQVMPSSGTWASDLVGRPLNLNNAQDNVTGGVAIIRALVRSSPSLDIAIASYYQGQYSVLNRGMYEDTKVYVAQVLKRQASFQ